MSSPGQRLRKAITSHRPERGKRYAPELRARIVAFAMDRHSEGASWQAIADELGIATETLRSWRPAVARSAALVPVDVVPEATFGTVSVVSSSGYRIEGLSLDDAVHVLRSLG